MSGAGEEGHGVHAAPHVPGRGRDPQLHPRRGAAAPHPVRGEPPDQGPRDRARRAALHPGQAGGQALARPARPRSSYAERILDGADALRERLAGRPGEPTGACARPPPPRPSSTSSPPSSRRSCARTRESRSRSAPPPAPTRRSPTSSTAPPTWASPRCPSTRRPSRSPSSSRTRWCWWWGTVTPWPARAAATIDELRKERFILFERGASIRRATDEFFNKIKVQPALALESNDTYFHQAHGRARPRDLPPALLGRARRGGLGLAGPAAHPGPPAPPPGGHPLAGAGSSPRPPGPSWSSCGERRAELQTMAEGHPRSDEPRPGERSGQPRRR